MGNGSEPNLLYYGDNLNILRRYVKANAVARARRGKGGQGKLRV